MTAHTGVGDDVDLRPAARDILTSATRAPSGHNAQPWSFRVLADAVEVWSDYNRRLPVVDPDDRELHISCGAALFGVRLALAGLGIGSAVTLLPDPARPQLLARATAIGRRPATDLETRLLAEIPYRRTTRTPFTDQDIPVPVRVTLGEHAVVEAVSLRWVEHEGERRGIATLVADGERAQQTDPAFRAELARWTGARAAARGEGVPVFSFGLGAGAGHAAAFAMRDFAVGAHSNPRSRAQAEEHPVIFVLATAGDTAADWLRAGQGLMRVLLAATAEGLSASYLNQPLEIRGLRNKVREELRLDGHPQMILRLGHPGAPPARPTPRRPVSDVLRY